MPVAAKILAYIDQAAIVAATGTVSYIQGSAHAWYMLASCGKVVEVVLES